MKLLIAAALILSSSPVFAQQSTSTRDTEATTALNCDTQVPGTSCPARYAAACNNLFCDTKAPEAPSTPNPPASQTDK